MRAVVIARPGKPDALAVEDVAEPAAGPEDLLVDVVAAGVNRADLLQAAGRYGAPAGAPPWPGLEVSGTVSSVGTGVAGWRAGDHVAALLPGGGYAQRVAVAAGLALRVPDEADLVDAAALPEALATAWSTFTLARLSAGESVLVRGGSGGVGTVAVQVAAAMGARVLATAGGPQRCARVRELGVEVVVDHRAPGFVAAAAVSTSSSTCSAPADWRRTSRCWPTTAGW